MKNQPKYRFACIVDDYELCGPFGTMEEVIRELRANNDCTDDELANGPFEFIRFETGTFVPPKDKASVTFGNTKENN